MRGLLLVKSDSRKPSNKEQIESALSKGGIPFNPEQVAAFEAAPLDSSPPLGPKEERGSPGTPRLLQQKPASLPRRLRSKAFFKAPRRRGRTVRRYLKGRN